jgi:hypothetical protein
VHTITKDYEDHVTIPQVSSNFIDNRFLKSLLASDALPRYDSRPCVYEIKQEATLEGKTSAFHVRLVS